MKVLSCFDGMSCGQIALDQLGIKPDKYYSSEVDKYSQAITKYNYPDTIFLGDITKWKDWKIDKPDLIIGGSPCQGFSFAGKRLNFDDPRSKLFFTFAEIIKHFKPKYFLLENVIMDQRSGQAITEILGVNPVIINSALVSAQNRKRIYWTNIPGDKKTLFGSEISQPKDRKIYLKDVLETDGPGFVNNNGKKRIVNKSNCIGSNYSSSLDSRRQRTGVFCGAFRGRNPENPNSRESGQALEQTLETRVDRKTNTLTSVEKDNVIVFNDTLTWRKLTPIECERLQTVPDDYTKFGIINDKKVDISKTQRYKMLGNGWTVEVIKHIFGGIK